MATSNYLVGRKQFSRPQAILWSENSGTLVDGLYVPTGQEVGAVDTLTSGGTNKFLILSDHNRSTISFNQERIENRKRTINGRMRSYHIADKLSISWSWNNLPSRAYHQYADFDSSGESPYKKINGQEYTVDGGAGGVEILNWYETHKGPFWMFLAYDKYRNFGNDNSAFGHLGQYNQIIEVYFSDFNYSVSKRGQLSHDFWDISVSLEEV
jgi:hypothetical protein